MEMTGEYLIAAPRQKVWLALNDPEALKVCIPGCEEVVKTSDTGFDAKVRTKIGPVSATFSGSVTLSDLDPPNGYTISGEGKGGIAGFAKGGAKVRLEDAPGGTLLTYEVTAQVGGKIAQLGARLIDGTAKKLADEFFQNFANHVGGPAPEAAHDDHGHDDHGHNDHGHEMPAALSDEVLNRDVGVGTKWGVWVTAGLVVVLLLLAIFGLGGGAGH